MNIKYVISLSVLSAFVALIGTSCCSVSVYWEDTSNVKDFPAGTSVGYVKKNYSSLWNHNFLKVNVNSAEESDNYTLKAGDFVRIWPT